MTVPIPSTSNHWPRRSTRRGLVACWTVTGLLAITVPAAEAEITSTSQAIAAHAQWLPYAPAPPTPAAVCIVDSGVNLNTDTEPVVTRRLALDGGTPDDVDPDLHHGTLMAMVAAAAVNDTGMVGAAPQIRVVSVRSADPPQAGQATTSPFGAYRAGIAVCGKYATADGVRTVELALARGGAPTPAESAALADEVTLAHSRGLNVVAAAGNDGGSLSEPASTPGIVAVGAADRAGVFCSFSNRGGGLDVLAPGCDVDTVDPDSLEPSSGQGTSQASAFFAGVLTALRAYRPDLSWSDAEQLLIATAPNGVLDVEQAFRAAGLGDVVDAGIAATPPLSPPPPEDPTAAPPSAPKPVDVMSGSHPVPAPRVWPRPIATVRFRRGVVSVTVSGPPNGAILQVTLQRRHGDRYVFLGTRRTRERSVRLKCARRPDRVAIMYRDLAGNGRDSPRRYLSTFSP